MSPTSTTPPMDRPPAVAQPRVLTAPEDLLLPDVGDLAGPGGHLETEPAFATETHVDTDDGALLAAGVGLHRVAGPGWTGWRLLLPPGTEPAELTSGSRSRTAPAALSTAVTGLTRARPLRPVATLEVHRTSTLLVGADGRLRAAVHDARVSSTGSGEDGRLDHWREITVAPGAEDDEALLSTLERLLRDAGAQPGATGLRVARALAASAPEEPLTTVEPQTLADLVSRYVAEQCDAIVDGDLALRLGRPQVHRTRVAIRRLRSTLRVFADLLDPGPTARLEEDLVWWAGLLGEVRDREVLTERLLDQLAALPPDLLLGDVTADVTSTLGRERARHLKAVAVAADGPRLLDLLESLARWRTEPAFLEGAGAGAESVRSYVVAAGKLARRRLRRARRQADDAARDEQLHRARKAAKRARYAAELAEPAWPGAGRLQQQAKQLQTLLGEHQDSVVTSAFLHRQGAVVAARGDRAALTYGVLLGAERERAARLRDDLRDRPD